MDGTLEKKKSLRAFLSFHTFPSNLMEKLTGELKLSNFETSRRWIANF
jgi:hypothetical protein